MSTAPPPAIDWLTVEFWTATPESIRDFVWVGGAIVGVLLLAWRTWAANKSAKAADTQAKVAEQGHITDRFTKAVEQLGNDHLEVRVGAIYALERIAKDSARDYWAIIETFATYVRQESLERTKRSAQAAAERESASSEGDAPDAPSAPRKEEPEYDTPVDIEAILTIFGRRQKEEIKKFYSDKKLIKLYGAQLNRVQWKEENLEYIDLSGSNLQNTVFVKTTFKNSKFVQANFNEARFEGVVFDDADCSGASFEKAVFQEVTATGANFQQAKLKQADLKNATLQNADFSHADLADFSHADLRGETSLFREGATLEGANLQGANFDNTNLENVNLRGADLSGVRFTEWRGEESQWEQVAKIRKKLDEAFRENKEKEMKDLRDRWYSTYEMYRFSLRQLYGTKLFSTDLRGANLSNVTGLTLDQLYWAKIDETTTLPRELEAVRRMQASSEAAEPASEPLAVEPAITAETASDPEPAMKTAEPSQES